MVTSSGVRSEISMAFPMAADYDDHLVDLSASSFRTEPFGRSPQEVVQSKRFGH